MVGRLKVALGAIGEAPESREGVALILELVEEAVVSYGVATTPNESIMILL